MIVRISGEGQWELDDEAVRKLDQLDTALTEAIHRNNEEEFHRLLGETVRFIHESGKEVPDTTVVPSQVIVPPSDSTMSEAQDFFTDEGLMEPLPA